MVRGAIKNRVKKEIPTSDVVMLLREHHPAAEVDSGASQSY